MIDYSCSKTGDVYKIESKYDSKAFKKDTKYEIILTGIDYMNDIFNNPSGVNIALI